MPCQPIKDGFICSNKIVTHKGYVIEFPPIGSPVMLHPLLHAALDYSETPKEFWDAVADHEESLKNRK